jgi:AcrR family transcriptional regulator
MGRNPERDRIQMERTRARLIEAGQEAILGTGLDRVKVRDIVGQAGLGVGTFYFHFGSLEQFLQEAIQGWIEEVRGRVRQIRGLRDGSVSEDPDGRIRDAFEAFFEYIDEHLSLVLILLRERSGGGRFGQLVRDEFRLFINDLAEDLEQVAGLGLVAPEVQPRLAAEAILGMTLQLAETYTEQALEEQKGRPTPPASRRARREQIIDTLTRISLIGLLAGDATGRLGGEGDRTAEEG